MRYPRRRGQSPLVGTRATQIPLMTGRRLTELQRLLSGFVLVREHGAQPVDAVDLVQAERTDDGPAVLVRPDGYIAWAGDSTDRPAWSAALRRWTGQGQKSRSLRS